MLPSMRHKLRNSSALSRLGSMYSGLPVATQSTFNHVAMTSFLSTKQHYSSLWQGHNRLTTLTMHISSSSHRPYSTTRLLGDKTSFFQSQASKWWKKGTELSNQVAEKSSSVAKDAASKTLHKTKHFTQSAADQASKRASESWSAGRQSLDQAFQQSSRNWQESASKLSEQAQRAAKEQASNLSKATSETFSKASQMVARKAHDSARATKQATRQAVEQNIQKPLQNTSKRVSESSKQLVETVTSSGTKVAKWMAMWSLAAIFVYGVATATPMAILKFMTREKHQEYEQQATASENTGEKRWWA